MLKKEGLQLQLSLSKPRMRTGDVEVQLHSFSISVLDGGLWENSRPGPSVQRREIVLFWNRRQDVTESHARHSGEARINLDF